jgi:hypothetical protein
METGKTTCSRMIENPRENQSTAGVTKGTRRRRGCGDMACRLCSVGSSTSATPVERLEKGSLACLYGASPG